MVGRTTDCTCRDAAHALAKGFVEHDQRNREGAVEAFQTVDEFQFPFLDTEKTTNAARAYVDALWTKDKIEDRTRCSNGLLDLTQLAAASYGPVEDAFARRAQITGADAGYATHKKEAWRQHKLGGDYWTHLLHGQKAEIRATLRDEEYPQKDRCGLPGFGTLPVLYLFGVELHDTVDTRSEIADQTYAFGIDVLTSYFERIQQLYSNNGN